MINVLPVKIVDISSDIDGQVFIRLRPQNENADTSLLSKITLHSQERLNLYPGDKLFAQIKSVALAK